MLMQTQSGLLNFLAQFLGEQGMYVVAGAGAGGAGFLKAGGVAEGHRRVAVAHTGSWRAHPNTTVLFFSSNLTSYPNSYRGPRGIIQPAVRGFGNFTRICGQ